MGFLLEPVPPRKEAFKIKNTDTQSWTLASPYELIADIEESAKKNKKRAALFHDIWEWRLSETFGIDIENDAAGQILLLNARRVFEDFQMLTAIKLGRDACRKKFFEVCGAIPPTARKNMLTDIEPRQFAYALTGFSFDDFRDDYRAMANDFRRGKAAGLKPGAKEDCLSLFAPVGESLDWVRKAAEKALDSFIELTGAKIGEENAVAMFSRLVQYIPRKEREKFLLAMTPLEFAEMFAYFLS